MKLRVVILLLLGFYMSSCKKPVSCFTTSAVVVKKYGLVSFDGSCSENANNYGWDFGDGTKGAGVTSSVKYKASGTYEVILTVYSRSGKTASSTQTVTVE